MRKYLSEFDCVRAILAWYVVLGHCFFACGIVYKQADYWQQLLMRGDIAVDGFIIISGFVITKLLVEKGEPYGVFIARRFLRLYPCFLVCFLATLALPGVPRDWWLLLTNLTLTQGLLTGNGSVAILVPAWSISLEWQFYLIAPFVISLLWPLRLRWWLLIACLLYLPINRHFDDFLLERWPMQSFLPQKLLWFLAGALLYRVLPNGLGLTPPRSLWWLQQLGRISYSTYLIHYPILLLLVLLVPGIAPVPLFLIASPVILLISSVLFGLVEQPAIQLGRSLARKHASPEKSGDVQAVLSIP